MNFRKHGNCYHIATENTGNHESTDIIIFYWGWQFDISFEICGYFDNRPRINLDLIFFSLTIIFPFRNKWENECDSPKWGISIHGNTVWIYTGGEGNSGVGKNWITWDIPFLARDWVRTSILLEDGTWEHEKQGDRKEFYSDEWKKKQMSWTHNYLDPYDGEIIPTTVYVTEIEWRPKWLKWTSLFAKVRREIDIHFSKEVGSEKGSWKGGVVGCDYELLPGEDPLDCLIRMEKERKF